MRKFMLAGLLGLAFSTLPAQGQYYGRGVTNPLVRSPGSAYGPYSGYPYYGNPAAFGPGFGGAFLPGGPTIAGRPAFAPGEGPVAGIASGPQSIIDPSSPNQTGHPVRWQAYRGYFLNPNASLMQGGAGAAGAGLNSAAQNQGLSRFTTPGRRPARGKDVLGTGP